MTNLPKYAERFFAVQVSDNDGVCHKAEEDVNGWDYVVELPNAPHSGSADSQPPHDRAFVQVKSTSAAKTSVAITLSNLRKSAQDRSPWFVVLIKKVNGKPALYIRHFWKSLMEKSLKAIRTAESEGKALNKATMAISFSDEDLISGDLVRWMQDQIRLVGDYQVEKRRLYDELGYENGRGKARLMVTQHTQEEIFSEFLGLGKGLQIAEFEYIPERFSIPDYSRKISQTEGTVHITPQPQGTCEVRFRSSPTERAFSLEGLLYAVPIGPTGPIRVSAPPVELVFQSRKVDLNMSIRMGEKMPLDHWHTYSTLKVMSEKGPLHVELWRDNRKIDTSIIIDRKTGSNMDWASINSLSSAIKAIADDRRIADLTFSLPDINAHIGDLGYLFQGTAPLLRFEFEATEPLEPGVTSLLYYSIADLGDWTFAHVVKRQVLSDAVEDDRRSITAGRCELLETYAFQQGATPEDREAIRADYEGLLTALEDREHPLGFGELGTYIRSLEPLNAETLIEA